MKSFADFTRQYTVSKTERFRLKPLGATLQYIERDGFLKKDEKRADQYQKLKKWIDEYHREFIEETLSRFVLETGELKRLYELDDEITRLAKKHEDSKVKKALTEKEKLEQSLRKQIADAFTKAEQYKALFKKPLIQDEKGKDSVLKSWARKKQNEKPEKFKELIDVTLPYFAKFNTYLTGFYENRKNMYSKESKQTAISARIVDTNWPRFMRNSKQWQKIQNNFASETLAKLNETFAEELARLALNEVTEIFDVQNFCRCLTQSGIECYNTILGGKSLETEKEKIKGLNEYLNLAHQQQGAEKKRKRIRLLKLHNQILGQKNSHSFVLEAFDSERDLFNSVRDFYCDVLQKKHLGERTLLESISDFMKEFPYEDLENIYLRNDTGLTNISQKIFDGDWAMLGRVYQDYEQESQAKKPRKKAGKNSADKAKPDYYSIAGLENALLFWEQQQQDPGTEDKAKIEKITGHCIADYFRAFGEQRGKNPVGDFAQEITQSYKKLQPLIEEAKTANSQDSTTPLLQNEENVEKLKRFLDSVMDLLRYLKPLSLKTGKNTKENADDKTLFVKNEEFYSSFDAMYGELEPLFALYNKVRNYVTQKPYSMEKFKLNFDNATLLNGWDLNKESDNYGMILQKERRYYLVVLHPKHKKILKELHKPQNIHEEETYYQKMVYKLVPGPNKMLPKISISSEKGRKQSPPDEELLSRYEQKTHLKNEPNFCLADCHKLIDYFKASIQRNEDWCFFDFQFSETSSYEDLSGFYREFEKQSYRITFVKVPERSIDEWVSAGKLLLFEIYNKDFSAKTKGKPNLHTMYWRALFDPKNLEYRDENNFVHPVFKLSGEAEIFYRRASLDANKIEHPKGKPIKNKQHNQEKTFVYDISKDRRYKENQFFFHVPLAINHAIDEKKKLNHRVRELLASDTSINIIGIDRGERNLAYTTVIDQNGKILAQGSLNEIQTFFEEPVDYHKLLDGAEKKRKDARVGWKQIGKIKDLKNGYISQVVHKICTLMRKYNAIVVLEDLNSGFKRGRFAIEKQVYQKLERALIQKLNYLVFKDLSEQPFVVGSALNGLQLCEPFKSFEKLGKQTGVLFYVPAAYTSKIDPLTGFTNLFPTKSLKYSNLKNAQEFLGRFDVIIYDEKFQCLRFDFCYDRFEHLHVQQNDKKIWQVFAKGERLIYSPRQRKTETVCLKKRFEKLLEEHLPDYRNSKNLKDAILNIEDVAFFREFLPLFKATLQMRNSCREAGEDYIASPVQDENGRFFHSDAVGKTGGLPKELPCDADANGAYHIALKGLQYILRMRKAEENAEALDKVKLYVKDTEWLEFVQKKAY